jgi:iron complex outermembrane recepter protein
MRRVFLWLAALSVSAPLTVPLGAQDPSVGTDTIPLPAVVVTVLRSPLEAGSIPYVVAVNDVVRIQRGQPGAALDEALRGIPGVQVDNRFNAAVGERISIRGFGARTQFGVRGIRVVVDGIPATLPDGQTSLGHVDPGTLWRAEVIRGPAAALYGNSAGGVIQFETTAPPPQPLRQHVRLVSGSDGMIRLHSSTGGTRDGTSYILNVSRFESQGFREHSAARSTWVGGRIGHRTPSGELRLVFTGVDSDAENPGSLSLPLLEADRTRAFANNVTQRTGKASREGQAGLSWVREFGPGTIETAAYALRRSVTNPIPTAIIELDRTALGIRSILRGGEHSDRFRWAAGIEADRQRDDRVNRSNQAGDPGPVRLDQLERVRNVAGFVQLSAEPADRLTLLAGLRLDHFVFRVRDRFVDETDPDDSGSRTMAALSPSAGLSVEVLDRTHMYANIGSSFETPTTTELANRPDGAGGFNPTLEPQRALSFEAGLKGRVADRLTYQTAVYRARVRDALIPFEVPEAAGRQFYRNAGSTVHRGVEGAATLAILQGLRAEAAYTFTDARFERYVVGERTFDGNRVPGVAPHRLEATAIWEGGGGFHLTTEGRYLSAIPADDANAARSPAYFLLDVRSGFDGLVVARSSFSPFVGVTNLLDTEYNASVTANAFGARFFEPGPGRSLHVGLSVRL